MNDFCSNVTRVNAAARTVQLANSFAANVAMINGAAESAQKASAMVGPWRHLSLGRHRLLLASGWTPKSLDPKPASLRAFQLASSDLTNSQRGWLASGIRSWISAIADREIIAVEARPVAEPSMFDLGVFLRRRQLRQMQRRGVPLRAWVWLRDLAAEILPSLVSSFGGAAPRHVLLAVLAAPPGWATATRFRCALEAAIARTLAQLADLICPNAPSRPDSPRRFLITGGNPVPAV